MDPFGGNQQIAINSPGFSSGWRIVAAWPVFVDVTLWPEGSSALPQDTVPRPKWTLGLWRTTFLAPRPSYLILTKMEMHYRRNEFKNFLQNFALDAHDGLYRKSRLPWPSSDTARGLGLGGGMINYRSTKGGIYLKRLRITGIDQYIDIHMETGRWGRTIYGVKYTSYIAIGLNFQL